jgi:hypothetical protein
MQFFVDNSMYVTLIIASLILVGIQVYMSRIDSRLRKIEQKESSS